jgi:hypothetical protein
VTCVDRRRGEVIDRGPFWLPAPPGTLATVLEDEPAELLSEP